MTGSRKTFASDAGRYIHVGAFAVLFLLALNHPVALLFLAAEAIHLWRRARRLFFWGILAAVVLGGRVLLITARPAFTATAFDGIVTETATGRFTVRTAGIAILVFSTAEVEPGDRVAIEGRPLVFEPRSIPHGFDDGATLRADGVSATYRASSVTRIGHGFVPAVIARWFLDHASAHLAGEALALVRLFVLGDSGALPDDLAVAGRRLGIAHLFAVSGMHVGAVALFLDRLLVRGHVRKEVRAILIALALGVYMVVCGFTPSVVRATLAYGAALLSKLVNAPFTGTDNLAFVALAVLVVNPFALEAVGFQLSYLVSLALLLAGAAVRAEDPFKRTLLATLFANAAALPLLLELQGSFNLAAIAANVVFIPLVTFVAQPTAFLAFFVPAVEPAATLVGKTFFAAIAATGTVDLTIAVNLSNDLAKSVYWVIFLLAAMRLSAGRTTSWHAAAVTLLLGMSALLPAYPIVTQVRILDVGQGDAIHVVAPGCGMLIDTGKPDGDDTLVTYFLKENIHHLDYVVLTHADDDHAGAIGDLDARLDIGAIVAGGILCPSCRAPAQVVATDDVLVCGTVTFTVVAAGDPSENDGSVVLYARIGSDRWLFTGDAGTAVERELAGLEVDVLKVGHHGSATATSAAFVTALAPTVAVVSVGRTNGYGHPDPVVLARLAAVGAVVLRTDACGSIIFTYPPWGGRVVSCYSEDVTIGRGYGVRLLAAAVFPSRPRRGIMGTVI